MGKTAVKRNADPKEAVECHQPEGKIALRRDRRNIRIRTPRGGRKQGNKTQNKEKRSNQRHLKRGTFRSGLGSPGSPERDKAPERHGSIGEKRKSSRKVSFCCNARKIVVKKKSAHGDEPEGTEKKRKRPAHNEIGRPR